MVCELMEQTIKTLEGPNSRVLIIQKGDGAFTYRIQTQFRGKWSKAGPGVGVYDSAETAEQEARARVWWLANLDR